MQVRKFVYTLFAVFIVLNISAESFSLRKDDPIKYGFSSDNGKSIGTSGYWQLKNGGFYYSKSINPMIQIKASGVVLDLEQYAIENKSDKNRLVIAIEVGFSKSEIENDPTLDQVSNVTIKNGCFINFDVGIIVHSGVNTISIENCSFNDISQGIVFLGTGNKKDDSTIRVTVKNCTIIGHGKDYQEKLVQLKNKVEGLSIQDRQYAYGQDTYMPLYKDIISDVEDNDVYAYGGIIANRVHSLILDNICIQNIGYRNYTNKSEGTGRRTAAVGIFCRRCAGVTIKDSSIYSCSSEVDSVGIKVESVRNIHIKNSDCTYQKSACRSCSIEVTDTSDYDERLSLRERTMILDNVRCELNKSVETDFTPNSPEIAIGLYIKGLYSIYADNFYSLGHTGKKISYGMYAEHIINSTFEHSFFNNNKSSRDINDIESVLGIVAMGCRIKESESLIFRSCDFSNNFGNNTGIGCSIAQVQNVEYKDCTFTGNKGVTYQKNERASTIVKGSLLNEQDIEEISKSGPVVTAAWTGGYGFVADSCQRLGLFGCKAQNNIGHRATGYLFRNSGVIGMENSLALYQYAYGDFLHSDLQLQSQGGIIPDTYDIPILDIHRPILFDNIFAEKFTDSSLNILDYTSSFLAAVADVRSGWITGKFISLGTERNIVKTLSLLFSLIARFRLWGTSFGVHMHNCTAVLVKKCNFSGQISQQDNVAGFVVTGRSSDFYMEHSELSYNSGWRESNEIDMPASFSYEAKYNLSAVKSLWDMLFIEFDQAQDESAGFLMQDDTLIAQGKKEFDGSGNDISVTTSNKKQTFVNMIAPISAGLILGDCCYSGALSNNKFHANKGNAGYCTGLLFHTGENFLVQDNIFDDNAANIYGHCCGLMDMNLYSENNYLRNRFSFNSVDGFYNSHSLIVSDTRSKLSVVYPLAKFNDGAITSKVSEIDNIEINLPSTSFKEKKASKKKKRDSSDDDN